MPLYGLAQFVGEFAILLVLVFMDRLIAEEAAQMLPAVDEVFHPCQQHLLIEWLDDVAVGSALVSVGPALVHVAGREQQHGDMARRHIGFQPSAEFQTIHHRHHHVCQHQVGHLAPRCLKPLLAIGSTAHLIIFSQPRAQIGAYVGIVVHHEDVLAGLPVFRCRERVGILLFL